jgi:hypothetical protein
MANRVYHFSDTVRLPWIIETGKKAKSKSDWRLLQDPLWPTTSDKADRRTPSLADRRELFGEENPLRRRCRLGDARSS